MSDDTFPFPGGEPQLPSLEADALLAGGDLPSDVSAQARALSEALAPLRAGPLPSELADEKGVLAAVRAAEKGQLTPGRGLLTARSGMKVAIFAAVGSLALGGAAAAATTGSLPGPLQRAAHVLGAPEGGDDQGDDQGDQSASPSASGSESATPSPTPSESASASASASASESESGSRNGVGPDATGPAAFGLCHAFANTTTSSSVAFRNLQKAASDKGMSVKAYCTVILALGPGNHHAHGDQQGGDDHAKGHGKAHAKTTQSKHAKHTESEHGDQGESGSSD